MSFGRQIASPDLALPDKPHRAGYLPVSSRVLGPHNSALEANVSSYSGGVTCQERRAHGRLRGTGACGRRKKEPGGSQLQCAALTFDGDGVTERHLIAQVYF